MRILMIIDGLPGGGAEKVLLTLAQGFITLGHRVSIFSTRRICDYILPKDIDYQVTVDHAYTPWRKLTELSRRAKALDKVIYTSQKHHGEFNIIFSHLHKTDRIVARSRILQKKIVWFCLHTMFSYSYLSHRKSFFRWLKRYKIHTLYQGRNIIAVSYNVLKDIRQTFKIIPRHAKVIYNPFDFTEIRRLANFPCELAGQDYLIHVGRLHKNKCQDRLLKAYANSNIQAPIVILGNGSNVIVQELKLLADHLQITDRVKFKDFNINPYPYIFNARMLVLSSDYEGFSNVIVESLICHTPVVSTHCPGGPVEILNGRLSIGLADLNVTSLAKTMKLVYEHPVSIADSDIDMYDINKICKQYIALV